jgi:glycosyltransferase involved in cell wall biosynthesis
MPVTAANVAMLCQGDEVYGIGTIQKIYAQTVPDMLFVCTREGPMLQWLREHARRVLYVPAMSNVVAASSVRTLLRIPRLLHQARRDAGRLDAALRPEGIRFVHTHWLPQQLLGVWLRKRGYRVAWQINNLTSRTRLFGMGIKLNHLFARKGADVLLPASDFIADFWRGSGVPMRTVHNAAIPLYAGPNELADSTVRCVIAGRMEESKGHHLAVQAVIAARRVGLDVTLDLFGGPLEANPYADALRERIAREGYAAAIRLMGFCGDLRQRHQSYHLGLQCRIDPEPCSLWVCETLADGLPLLAASNGGTPELVRDGVTGLLFRSGDAHDLTEKLIALARDPDRLRAMRPAAFARGRDHFTPDRFVRETFEGYELA